MAHDPDGRAVSIFSSQPVDRFDGSSLPPVRTDNLTPELRAEISNDIERARMDAAGDPVRQANLDAFANELTGLGTIWGDKTRGGLAGGPAFVLVRMTGPEAEARARGSDLGHAIVNRIPDEMTREGWTLEIQPTEDEGDEGDRADAWPNQKPSAGGFKNALGGANSPAGPEGSSPSPPAPAATPKINDEGIELARAMEEWGEEVRVERAVNQALRYKRCFGGGAVLIGVDDGEDDLTRPLDPKKVKRVTHLTTFAGGWDGECVMWRPYNDPRRANYGRPEIYQIRNLSVPLARLPAPGETTPVKQSIPSSLFYVHESRLMVFSEPTSRQVEQEMRGWGDSVFTRVNDVLSQYEQTWSAVVAVMQEFSIINMAIDGYSNTLASKNPKDRDILLKRARELQLIRSVARMNVYDAKDKVERMTASFSGVSELLDGPLVKRLAAAADMPVSLLFGQVKGAMGGDAGDADTRFFYDRVRAWQTREMVPQLTKLYRIVWQSKEGPSGGVVPERWSVVPRPLWQSTPSEQADVRLKTSQADQIEIQNEVVTPAEVTAKRYGGAEYDPGPIVIDLEGRAEASALEAERSAARQQAQQQQQQQSGGPGRTPTLKVSVEQQTYQKVPPMTATPIDPITAAPSAVVSEVGQTGVGGKPLKPTR